MDCSDTAAGDVAAPNLPLVNRRVRLLTVNSTLHMGGAERVAAALAQYVDRQHFDSVACYLKQPGFIAEQMLRAGVDLAPVPGLTKGTDYLSFRRLRRLIVARGIDVIHTHDTHGLVDGALCRLTLPRLRHVHTFHFGNYPHRGRLDRSVERLLWRVPDALVAVGNAQAATLRSMYGIPPDRLRVLWNGVGDPQSDAAARTMDSAAAPVIVSVSTLTAQKGLEHLVDAAKLLRDGGENFRLEIVGGGPLHDSLVARTRAHGLEGQVLFRGRVPQASTQALPPADIFVQSSLWEAMSVVVLEAMAAGKAMVVTRVGENPYVINENNGLLVPPGDAPALAAALRRLLRDAALRARLGAAARAHYLQNFTTRHMTAGYESLYRELAQRAGAAGPA